MQIASGWWLRPAPQPESLVASNMDSKGIINAIFGVPRALIGVIHVGALPGTPGSRQGVAEIAEVVASEARVYAAAGFHGLAIENTHDRPYLKSSVGHEIVAAIAAIGSEVRRAAGVRLGMTIIASEILAALVVVQYSGARFR